jgi:hypothetical protein
MKMPIGEHSFDWFTFVLFRKRDDINIRKYPGTIGISTRILLDLIDHKTKLIIVKVDRIPCFKVDPRTWIEKGITDKLSPDQDPHSFLSLRYFEKMGTNPELLNIKIPGEEPVFDPITKFL